jgi:hypothetical protein
MRRCDFGASSWKTSHCSPSVFYFRLVVLTTVSVFFFFFSFSFLAVPSPLSLLMLPFFSPPASAFTLFFRFCFCSSLHYFSFLHRRGCFGVGRTGGHGLEWFWSPARPGKECWGSNALTIDEFPFCLCLFMPEPPDARSGPFHGYKRPGRRTDNIRLGSSSAGISHLHPFTFPGCGEEGRGLEEQVDEKPLRDT